MSVPAGSRWWIATLLIVGVLMTISALALDRPNVVWDDHAPTCPSCRKNVEMHSSRCAACGSDFDWVISPADQSPVSNASLSVLESEWLRDRVATLGAEPAATLVAESTGLSKEAALEYLSAVGHGKCGWCGGTRKDLAAPALKDAPPCSLCFGTGTSIACGGNRRVTLGNWAAEKAIQAYEGEIGDLTHRSVMPDMAQAEARRLAEEFLRRFAGTDQAAHIYFWPRIRPQARPGPQDRAVQVGRERLWEVLGSLRTAE